MKTLTNYNINAMDNSKHWCATIIGSEAIALRTILFYLV